ncbi:hypothetical protein C2E23DRAFT_808568 [Lenzites betulinus]|nr:hypothetical protein C2E23DRAFT_808568 [Lenzites betulinus]
MAHSTDGNQALFSHTHTTQASQSSALARDALAPSELVALSYPISYLTFSQIIANEPKAATIPVSCVEIYKLRWSTIPIVQATTGFLGHQYVIATVTLADGRNTYIKADYLVEDHPCASSRLIITFNDDHNALTRDTHLISRIVSPLECYQAFRGPSLAAFATLLGIADTRLGTRPYRVLGRNCLWMSDILFYTLARRYADHWLAGNPTPAAPLRRYLRGQAGALETAVACTLTRRTARSCGWWTAYVLRWAHVLCTATQTGADRYLMYDDEIVDWMLEWDEAQAGADSVV